MCTMCTITFSTMDGWGLIDVRGTRNVHMTINRIYVHYSASDVLNLLEVRCIEECTFFKSCVVSLEVLYVLYKYVLLQFYASSGATYVYILLLRCTYDVFSIGRYILCSCTRAFFL